MATQEVPTPLASTTFEMLDGTDPKLHPYYSVTWSSFDGSTVTTREIATIHYDPHRQQWFAQTDAGRTRFVSDARIAFDDAVSAYVAHHTNPAVQAAYRAAAAAYKTLAAEEDSEAKRNAPRREDGKRPFPGTRRGLVSAQYGWFNAQFMLAKVLEAVDVDVEGYKGVSGDRATKFLMAWMERNPNG